MKFKELLNSKNFVFFDGAMGTMLQNKGLKAGGIPEELNVTEPELLAEIHKEYIAAGADVIYANTFGANSYKLSHSEYDVKTLVCAAIDNARNASKGTDTLVALDVGPVGQLLEPTGVLSFEKAYEYFREIVLAGQNADLVVFETMTDLYELKAAVLAAKENTSLPVVCTMTFEENRRTFTGTEISAMALTLEGLGIDAIGVNCSLGPKQLEPIVCELSKWTTLPIVLKPNAGLPNPETNLYDVSAEEFAVQMKQLVKYGVKVFGGCCGTNPDYIRETVKALENEKYTPQTPEIPVAVCSATKTVTVNAPVIIGERINPTGKKLFKQALMDRNIDYILGQAIEQTSAGAEILDVNVGLPGIDEAQMMIDVVKAVQGVTDAPLQLDTTDPAALEKALRVYNGKPIVNSVNGEEKSLNTVLPLVKRYGACVVGLTLDENGIPQSGDGHFEIAKKILDRALKIGIKKENVFIDCLTLTASAEQEGVMETVKALRRVKTELGLKTVLGVSNISFGLPNRELVNSTFLSVALANGLDLPIINPNIPSMSGAVRAYRVLANFDKNSTDFISCYANKQEQTKALPVDNGNVTLDYAVSKGLKAEGAKITASLLETSDSMEIVNTQLIPALDKAGAAFEKGEIFLPQLIQTAGVAQACFEVIKQHLSKNGNTQQSKGKIVIATVKGDIHDIGKNIVKVLLENYGYTVIDLGKDVESERIVSAAIEHNVKLVGLSALMTTTLPSMEEAIRLIRNSGHECKIMVGGAVLTADYAEKIGADFYAKDAKESVDIAKKVIG